MTRVAKSPCRLSKEGKANFIYIDVGSSTYIIFFIKLAIILKYINKYFKFFKNSLKINFNFQKQIRKNKIKIIKSLNLKKYNLKA